MGTPIAGWIVPQQQYSSGSGRFQPRPPIRFSEEGRWGMRLKRALDMDFRGMPDGAAQAVLSETGTKVAIRILVSLRLPYHQLHLTILAVARVLAVGTTHACI